MHTLAYHIELLLFHPTKFLIYQEKKTRNLSHDIQPVHDNAAHIFLYPNEQVTIYVAGWQNFIFLKYLYILFFRVADI